MKPFIGPAAALALGVSGAGAADKPYEGITLNLASQNDQFAAVLAAIAPEFEAQTGAKTIVRDPACGTPSHRASAAGKNPCP